MWSQRKEENKNAFNLKFVVNINKFSVLDIIFVYTSTWHDDTSIGTIYFFLNFRKIKLIGYPRIDIIII